MTEYKLISHVVPPDQTQQKQECVRLYAIFHRIICWYLMREYVSTFTSLFILDLCTSSFKPSNLSHVEWSNSVAEHKN